MVSGIPNTESFVTCLSKHRLRAIRRAGGRWPTPYRSTDVPKCLVPVGGPGYCSYASVSYLNRFRSGTDSIVDFETRALFLSNIGTVGLPQAKNRSGQGQGHRAREILDIL